MTTQPNGLEVFHPIIRQWFETTFGEPTQIQNAAWPEIAASRHVLACAPTGTGKTLTAFLWALDQLLTGTWAGGKVRVLYVSPLKALNNDIERNLLRPLAELETAFELAGTASEPVRVATRSGDTPSRERQRMVRRPPEILITTPESLNILLTSRGGRSMLDGVATVISDEIHAAAGSKRGTHWITAVDRLVPLAGDFQRIALSATVRPPETIARFVGGYEMQWLDDRGAEVEYRPRPVVVLTSSDRKQYDLTVDVAGDQLADTTDPTASEPDEDAWESLARKLRGRIEANRSTLVFANSRRTTERLTRLLNDGESRNLVYSHHGSLSRELRSVVEKRLKEGELKSIVATNSLELGIDIGALDEVDLVQTPPTVAAAIQRLGRAGHGVGEVSKGLLIPLFERDLLNGAVVARCVLDGDIEAIEPIENPLDVLAQIILSMTAAEPWDLDALYSFLRSSWPYHRLTRRQFDLVLEMLAGRYADSRVRELSPRVTIDRVANVVEGRKGAAWTVYMSGGTIPDRGYYNLRVADSMARIGELDEEFVWERRLGDTFSLGAQNWQVRQITHSDVLVSPARHTSAMAPFWRADARNRSFFLSLRIGEFLETAEELLAGEEGREGLAGFAREHCAMSSKAADRLVDLLERQREATGVALPHHRHLVIEMTHDPSGDGQSRQAILHTGWGGRVNRPLAIAMAAAWSERHDVPLAIEAENDCILIALQADTEVRDLLDWVRPDNLETLLRSRLQRTGLFGGLFRENAGRALLLPRSDARRRIPLWLTRERAKNLLDTVSQHEDFPVVVETWRSCLQDTFDLAGVRQVLDELNDGTIRTTETATDVPSPFAAALVWQQTNRLMYEDDVPEGDSGGLSQTLLQELVFSSQLRPLLPAALLDTFGRKLRRTFPGYAPVETEDVLAWLDERLLMTSEEFGELLDTRARQHPELDTAELLASLEGRACRILRPGGVQWVGSIARLPRLMRGLDLEVTELDLCLLSDPQQPAEAALDALHTLLDLDSAEAEPREPVERLTDLLAEWLRFFGPLPASAISTILGVDDDTLDAALARLVAEDQIVVDRFRRDEDLVELCDARNLERLLRLLRAESRPGFKALALDQLPLLLAAEQGLTNRGDGIEGLQSALEALFLYPAPAAAWETDLLPARLAPYYPAWLDSVVQESHLLWLGAGRERLTFAFGEERELLEVGESPPLAEPIAAELAHGQLRSFEALVSSANLPSEEVAAELWKAVWAGTLSNSLFSTARKGIEQHFKSRPAEAPASPSRRSPRRGTFDRWRSSRPFGGDWFSLPAIELPTDALEAEDLARDRARLLLSRYGIVFRELLERELSPLRWSRVFRSLRLMELSGEVVSGHFFEGIPGPQFLSQRAWRRLTEGLAQDSVHWLSAVDPASPAGLGLDPWRGRWPARRSSNHMVFAGARPVVVSLRHGADLRISVPQDHPALPDYLEFIKVMLTRHFQSRKAVDVETINGEAATTSDYGDLLSDLFSTTREPGSLRLRRRY